MTELEKVKKYSKGNILGHGSFGIVYESVDRETGETVAIKSVFQDRRYKNRELQIMKKLDHPNVVKLHHYFYHRDENKDPDNDLFVNLVMEYIPDTIHRVVRNHTKAHKKLALSHIRVYMWQLCRSLYYIHSLGICHRDIKPHNLLVDPHSHIVKLADFGSAKKLVKNVPNVSYICSRYYRAPELIFSASNYESTIDIWSMGCVFAEMLLGYPLFAGETSVDQLIEIIKVLGTPTKDQVLAMNPNYRDNKFPRVKPNNWYKIFQADNDERKVAVDLLQKFLVYDPSKRVKPLDALADKFFDPLREKDASILQGKELPPLFNFTTHEVMEMMRCGSLKSVVPPHLMKEVKESLKFGDIIKEEDEQKAE